MVKLVLVEDEEIIRSGILDSIDWTNLGIEVVGQAEDGEQAAELIERVRPDIVVTDIRMPFMDGLALAEQVVAKYSDTAFVIISGYDDFRYAQTALKIGVEDYILKPVDLEYFSSILRKLCQKLENRAREKREIEGLREDAARSERFTQERLLRDLVVGRLPEGEAERRLPQFNEPGNWFIVIEAAIDDDSHGDAWTGWSALRREVERSLDQTIRLLIARGLFLLEDGGVSFVLGAMGRQKEDLITAAGSAARSVRRCCAAFPGTNVTVGIGDVHEGIAGLKASWEEARKARACRYILGSNRTIGYSEVRNLTGDERGVHLYNNSELVWAVTLSDRDAIRDNLKRLLADLSKAGELAAHYLQMYVASIFTSCLDAVLDEGGSVEEVFSDPIATYNRVLSQRTAVLALDVLEEALVEIAAYLETDRSSGQRHVIEKAKRYLRRNFGRFDLSLEEVAEFVHLSPSYLSSVFSRNEGKSFIDYLSHLRLERAKELLVRSPYRTYEIADMVGYSSPTYFSSVFKKHENCSPGEFRKNSKMSSSKPCTGSDT